MKANGENVKTVQDRLRHANSSITLDTYTQAVPEAMLAAQSKLAAAMHETTLNVP